MTVATETAVYDLSDGLGRDLGRIVVEAVRDGWLLGEFIPGHDYAEVEPAFRSLAEMVETFSLHHTDEAMQVIDDLGLTLRADPQLPPARVGNVQIDSEGGFACEAPDGFPL